MPARTADAERLRLHDEDFRCRTEPLTVRTFLLTKKLCGITFYMSGSRRRRGLGPESNEGQACAAGASPLDGSLEFRAKPHTDHEPGTVQAHAVLAGSVAD